MSSEEELRLIILRKQLGPVVDWVAIDPPPRLSTNYERLLAEHKARFDEAMTTADMILRVLSLEELKEHYHEDGRQKDEALNGIWVRLRDRLKFVQELTPIFLAGLGDQRYAADYDYWSRMETLKFAEVVWLCVGLNPAENWEKTLRLSTSMAPPEDPERAYILDIREQLERFAKSLSSGRDGLSGSDLLGWMKATNFPAHPSFVDTLEKILGRQEGEMTIAMASMSGKSDRREITAMARILTAIAIREYGYRPGSNKSPIPKEIEAICDEAGLSVSRETILKYLRLGARNLPKDG